LTASPSVHSAGNPGNSLTLLLGGIGPQEENRRENFKVLRLYILVVFTRLMATYEIVDTTEFYNSLIKRRVSTS